MIYCFYLSLVYLVPTIAIYDTYRKTLHILDTDIFIFLRTTFSNVMCDKR